jgi:hypothetical protein
MTNSHSKKLKIAFTASIGDAYQAIWGSGIIQNILLVYQLYQTVDCVEDVCLLDFLQDEATPVRYLDIAGHQYKVINKETATAEMDVLIEVGTQIWTQIAQAVQARGGKLISMRCGNAFIDEVMGIFSNREPLIPINFVKYDQVWTLPHHARLSNPMLETMYRCPVVTIPYIWEPHFIKFLESQLNVPFDYSQQKALKPAQNTIAKKIGTCEPNLSPIKTFHTPALVAESLFQTKPELIQSIVILNAWRYHDNPSTLHFINRLSSFSANKVTFESRFDIIKTLTEVIDVIISHHWDNGLNNLYFDALYAGYPLVHNSSFLKDVGYYYEDFNIQQGAQMLEKAILHHDEHLDEYREKVKNLLPFYSISNPNHIDFYKQLLLNLFTNS